jgi:ubiquinone/menaquinone biosynthesis C-methylase UbiE
MNYISTNKQVFGNVAKEYKKFRGNYNQKLFKLITSLLEKNKHTISILDLGCGVGNSTEPLVKELKKMKTNFSIIGCDPDNEMLTVARKSALKEKLPITYIQGIAEKLPFIKNQFDLIFSGAAFHWFATKKALKEISTALNNGGIYLVFWTQNRPDKKPIVGAELYKKYNWKGIPKQWRDPQNVQNLLRESGFKNVQITTIPYTEKLTIPETVGLMKTSSGYALLSPAQQKEIVKELTKEYKHILGTKLNIIKQDIYVCYGAK